jgi:hypothetical protein
MYKINAAKFAITKEGANLSALQESDNLSIRDVSIYISIFLIIFVYKFLYADISKANL